MTTSRAPRIPDHELLCIIGRGSSGEVWLARSITGAYRAVKIIYRNSFDHDRPYEREFAGIKKFEPISRTSATQVDILHVGRNDTERFFYYVMELADDRNAGAQINPETYAPRTLRSELYKRGRLPLSECLEIGLQLTTALEHLHGNGLVHRDIKPSNVVFVGGIPKLADMGLVTFLDATKSFVGTEGYIPLEGPGTLQADLYGLGKVLYEIATGRDRLDFPELPSDLRDDPERKTLVQLNDIFLRACDEDRKRRYRSAAEMRADLAALNSGQPLRHGRSRLKRTRNLVMIALAGVLVFCLFVAVQQAPRIRRLFTQDPGAVSGLVAWWKADGNALDSAGTNNGTLLEGAGFAAGRIGQAFSFNGTTACVSVPNSPAWAFGTNDFSIALWAKFSRNSGAQAFLACDCGIRNSSKWIFCLHDGLLQWHTDGGTKPTWLGSAKFAPAIGQWYHLAITRGGSNYCFYINGSKVSSEAWAGTVAIANVPLTIGNAWGDFSFDGLLDDIRVYHRALTPGELKSMALVVSPTAQSREDIVAIGTRAYRRSEFLVSTSFIDMNSQANLTLLPSGNFLVAWHQGLHWHCYGQIYDSEGAPMGSTFLLNPGEPDGWQWGPSSTPLPNGGWIVAWGTDDQSKPVASECISMAQRFDSSRAPVGHEFKLDLPDWTCAASYTNGEFIAVGTYAVGPKVVTDMPIFARRFNSAGVPCGASFQVGAFTNGYATASAAYGTDGRFAFAWLSHTRNAMVRAYRSNEFSPFGLEFPANSFSAPTKTVSARYNSKNELTVAWSGYSDSLTNAMFVRRFDSNMAAEASERQVNEQAPANRWNNSLSIGTNDEALVSWDSPPGRISGRLLDRNGDPIGHEFRINQYANGSRTLGWEACPHTAVLGNGNLVAGWAGDGASGNGIYLTFLKFIGDTAAMPH
ncbi:MAG: LamG-like jellyroll fold domain-containing protein [Verrucomicrobiota bacterium]